MSGSSYCRSCGRPIVWASWKGNGRNVPLDPDPSPKGNVRRIATTIERGRVVFVAELVKLAERQDCPDEDFYMTHFVTCPNAALHRRPRKP